MQECSCFYSYSYHSKSFNTAGLDVREDQPGGAVDQGKYPTEEDDPLGPGHCADVLNTKIPARSILY